MKYKIVEGLYSFKVYGLIPTIKKRKVRFWLFFFCEESYEDDNDLDWHVLKYLWSSADKLFTNRIL